MDDLLAFLAGCGLSVVRGAEPGSLALRGPREHATPAVMAQLAAFRPRLVERLWPDPPATVCPECRCGWYVPEAEVRELVARGYWFCDRGPPRAGYVTAAGRVVPGYEGCPFRDREGRP